MLIWTFEITGQTQSQMFCLFVCLGCVEMLIVVFLQEGKRGQTTVLQFFLIAEFALISQNIMQAIPHRILVISYCDKITVVLIK